MTQYNCVTHPILSKLLKEPNPIIPIIYTSKTVSHHPGPWMQCGEQIMRHVAPDGQRLAGLKCAACAPAVASAPASQPLRSRSSVAIQSRHAPQQAQNSQGTPSPSTKKRLEPYNINGLSCTEVELGGWLTRDRKSVV